MYERIPSDTCVIYRFLVPNSDRNINYILSSKNNKESIIVDPLDREIIEEIIEKENLVPKYIVNTHAHPDHIKENPFFLDKYNLKLLAHDSCKELFEFKFDNIFENDLIKLGDFNIKVLHTPGHCPEHISLMFDTYLLCGDTIFNCGVGNTKFRGDVTMLYRTIFHKLKMLPDNFKILCGHDYFYNNILFLESIYKDSNEIAAEVVDFKKESDEKVLSPIQDLGFEKTHNPFLRIDELSFLDYLKDENLFTKEDIITRFKLLRVLRDEW